MMTRSMLRPALAGDSAYLDDHGDHTRATEILTSPWLQSIWPSAGS
jgi:hypothetical protein